MRLGKSLGSVFSALNEEFGFVLFEPSAPDEVGRGGGSPGR